MEIFSRAASAHIFYYWYYNENIIHNDLKPNLKRFPSFQNPEVVFILALNRKTLNNDSGFILGQLLVHANDRLIHSESLNSKCGSDWVYVREWWLSTVKLRLRSFQHQDY